jgi:hypothetical protein
MKSLTLTALAVVLVGALPRAVTAQAAPTGVRGDMIAQIDDAAGKIQQLAEAFPQDKYSWRPGAGVRSVSEAFMHVAGGNYFLMSFAGVAAPAGTSENMDAITDSAKVVDQLNARSRTCAPPSPRPPVRISTSPPRCSARRQPIATST